MTKLWIAAFTALSLGMAACTNEKKAAYIPPVVNPNPTPTASEPVSIDYKKFDIDSAKVQTLPTGLGIYIRKEGTGAKPAKGQTVKAHYSGMLTDGKKFDSSFDRNQPFEFKIGAGQVIRGWDEGFAELKVGTKAVLIIPSELGYGANGAGASIPPNATLIFEVELLGVK